MLYVCEVDFFELTELLEAGTNSDVLSCGDVLSLSWYDSPED